MPDIVNLTIDDKPVAVPKGTLIVEAAESVGITVPVFCYHPKLKPVGACRMCLVEVGTPRRNPDGSPMLTAEGAPQIGFMPKPQTACTTPVSPGMIVKTQSPMVLKAQKGILEFLLINHPLDCPVCDKGGECPLQDQTFRYGPGVSRFAPEDKQHFVKPIDLGRRIALDRERCVMCFRCVRFQEEIAGDPQIDVFQRGARAEIAVAPGQDFDSNFSGNTIELCPVGALTSKEFRFRARSWELRNVPSVCSHCAVGCNLTLQVRSNELLRILARDNDAVNETWICDRGRFDYEYVNHGRLCEPKVRRGDKQEAHGWPAAVEAAAQGLRQVVSTYGAAAVGGIVSPRLTNEDLYVFQKLMRTAIGTANVDYRLDGGVAAAAGMASAIADLDAAQAVFVIGSDIFDELPVLGLRLRKAVVHGQAKLVLAATQPLKLYREAHSWLRHSAGAELALLKALNSALRGENGQDAAQQAGLTAEQIDAAAKLLAGREPALIFCGERLAGQPGVAGALADLAAALGATLNILTSEANGQGARDMGCVPAAGGGLTGREMLAAAAAGTLKALWLVGVDPLAAAGADRAVVEQALANLDLLIVQDMASSEVSKLATVVLPGFSFAEAEGTYTSVERRVQRLRPALTPRADMRADWRIINDVGRALAGPAWDYAQPAEILAEIERSVPGYGGLAYGTLGATGKRLEQ